MSKIRRMGQESQYYFRRQVVYYEYSQVNARTEAEGQRELDRTQTPMRYCYGREPIQVGEFERYKRG